MYFLKQNKNLLLKTIDGNVNSLFSKADEQKQYARRHILKSDGVPERRDENTNEIALETFRMMGVGVSHADICRSHINGKFLRNKRRPIFVKFIRYGVRDGVYF